MCIIPSATKRRYERLHRRTSSSCDGIFNRMTLRDWLGVKHQRKRKSSIGGKSRQAISLHGPKATHPSRPFGIRDFECEKHSALFKWPAGIICGCQNRRICIYIDLVCPWFLYNDGFSPFQIHESILVREFKCICVSVMHKKKIQENLRSSIGRLAYVTVF